MSAIALGLKSGDVSKKFIVQGDYQTIFFWGAFDGATLKLQLSPIGSLDDEEWFDVTAYTKTNAGTGKYKAIEVGQRFSGVYARWKVEGGTANTLVNGALVGVR